VRVIKPNSLQTILDIPRRDALILTYVLFDFHPAEHEWYRNSNHIDKQDGDGGDDVDLCRCFREAPRFTGCLVITYWLS
jgi:hypothetical protein